jgi:hypothetical protein
MLRSQCDNLKLTIIVEQRIDMDKERVRTLLHCPVECLLQLRFGAGVEDNNFDSDALTGDLEGLRIAAFGFLGLTNTAMTAVLGFSSRSSWMRFGPSWLLMKVIPVTLPPGRLRLATNPYWIGSLPFANTIGMVAVADLAAIAETRSR